MFWLFKVLIKNPRKRGIFQYWWTGRSYPFIDGYRAARSAIWAREVRDGVPFAGSIFKKCLKTAVKGKLHSWPNLFRMATWNRLFALLEACKEKSDDS